MKKILFCLSIFPLMLTSCSGDGDSDPVNMNPISCSTAISNFTAVQNGDQLTFNISAAGSSLYYEASICPTGMCSGPDGAIIPLDVQSHAVSIAGMPFGGDVVVYLRAVCMDNSKGAWSGPIVVSIDEFCATPTNLQFLGPEFYWNYDNMSQQASNFQVQYGPQGFTLGSGTTATVNNHTYNGASMAAGEAYDFYVRAYCVNGIGYGNWAGPYTYMAQTNHNMCLQPVNVVANIQNTSNPDYRMASFSWNGNGENTFEYTLVADNNAPEEGIIETTQNSATGIYNSLYKWYDYDFYVRAVCDNGNRTEWVMLNVNLN